MVDQGQVVGFSSKMIFRREHVYEVDIGTEPVKHRVGFARQAQPQHQHFRLLHSLAMSVRT